MSPKFIDKKATLLVFFFAFISYPGFSQVSFEEAFPSISFNRPVEIQAAKDGSNRLFIVEHPGKIKVFPNNSNVTSAEVSTFLDIESIVSFNSGEEIGLLGLAFHPNYATNGFFYVYYTDRPSNYRINLVRYQVDSSNPNIANPSSATPILRFLKTGNVANSSNHNGGKITFGTDGYLYISVGDGGGAGDPNKEAQNLETYFGAILRIDVDSTSNGNEYGIPNDNPRVANNGLDELYAWGIRNTWKMSFDRITGKLWGADVGQGSMEEINIIENGGNYGWNRLEGTTNYSATSLITSPDIKPVHTYDRSNGDLSITGGYVYRGNNSDLNDKYIYGDYISGRVWSLDIDTFENELLFKAEGINISSFGLGESGEFFFSNYSSSGKIYKLNVDTAEPQTVPVNGIGNWVHADITGVNGIIEAVFRINDTFYVGGEFTSAGGLSVSNLAIYSRQNGWSSFGSGTNGKVNTINATSDGTIYIGGNFTEIDGVSTNNIAKWDGFNFTPLDSGTTGTVSKIGIDNNDNVYVGGAFVNSGNITTNNIALWKDNVWSALTDSGNSIAGTNNEIRSIAFDENNNMYVGGNFSTAGGNDAARIALWNGSTWNNLGLGTSGFVQAIAVTSDFIYCGGNFNTAGTQEVNRIARWNRNNSSWESLNYGLSGNVNSIITLDSFLYVGGAFQTASNNENTNEIVNNIARWSETNGWQALGPNFDVGVTTLINTLSFSKDNNELFVGGNFSTAGDINSSNIAVWRESDGCNESSISPIFTINGSIATAEDNSLTVIEGAELNIGINENLFFRITDFNGNSNVNQLIIPNTTFEDAGEYILTTTEGCSMIITIIIIEDPNGDEDNDGVININDDCPSTPNGEVVDSFGCGPSQLDDDNDGVSNADDLCPGTPNMESVDSNGCGESQLDDDNDGIFNINDICPNTPSGETADFLGCGDSQQDIDNDGVLNVNDLCNNTPNGEIVDSNGCSESQLDDDNDGISNLNDSCPNTPTAETVNSFGCSDSQLDDDNDGVFNADDICPDTPNGELADNFGCGPSQQDFDNDGIANDNDLCNNTPTGEAVDLNGCSTSQLDDDNDGITNDNDLCNNTPTGEAVDLNGCSTSQLDDDNDGVSNDIDACPGTPTMEFVNSIGCGESQLDDDNDGVSNADDICPNTPSNNVVNAEGCEIFSLPTDNFTIATISATCRGVFDGQLSIDAELELNYTAILTNVSFSETKNFNDVLIIDELPAGTYELCISVQNIQGYESCSTVVVDAPESLSVFSVVDEINQSITLQMFGSDEFLVSFNETTFKTTSKEITLKLSNESNKIKVSTGQLCQGVFEENIIFSSNDIIYPNPFTTSVNLNTTQINESKINYTVYSISGKELFNKTIEIQGQDIIEIPLYDLASGIYILKLNLTYSSQIFKLVKR